MAEPGEAGSGPAGRRARLGGRAALLAGLALHLLFLASLRTGWCDPLFLEARGSYGQGADYFGIYRAGDNLAHGRSIYDPDGRPAAEDRQVPYSYFYRYLPPTAFVAALDALLLRPWPAYWLWVATTEALLALFLLSLRKERRLSRAVREALAGLTLGFFPFYLEQWMGQFSFLMALLLWATFRPELARDGPPIAEPSARGLLRRMEFWCWTAATALKHYTALFALPYLRQGRWRRVVLAAGLILAASLPYFIARPEDLARFLHLNFSPLPPSIRSGGYGLATLVRALGWHLPSSLAAKRLALGSFDVHAGNLPVLLSSLLLLILSSIATWRMRPRGTAAEALALWTLTFFLIYKDIWEYHYVMLLPVIAVLAVERGARWPLLLGAWLALPTPYFLYRDTWGMRPVEDWPAWLVVVHYGWKVFPAVGLYILAWTGLRKRLSPAGAD